MISQRHGRRRPAALIPLLLLTLTALSYRGVGALDFVDFDDFGYVVENPHVRDGLSLDAVLWSLTHQHLGYWAPLTWISHMIDVTLFGLDPAGHHWMNLVLHATNVLLLYALLLLATGRPAPSAVVAALFAVHPVNVESVAWVAERKNLLSMLFWLLTLCSYVAWVRTQRRSLYLAVIGLMAAGLLVKATAVTLPFTLLLLDLWPLGRLDPARPLAPSLARLVREKLPLLALSVLSSVVTFWAQQETGAVERSLALETRLANAVVSYVRYLGKLFWPTDLAVLYPFPALLGLEMWTVSQVLICAALLAALSAGVLFCIRRQPYLGVGWFWYLGVLVPVIGLVQVGVQSMADRHLYVAMIGVLVAVVWLSEKLLGHTRAGRAALALGAGVLASVCILLTRVQVRTWTDTLTLFEHALAVTDDNWIALNNVAWLRAACPDARVRDGARAVALAEQACRLTGFANPELLDTLAAAQAEAGDFKAALRTSRRALRLARQTEGSQTLARRLARLEAGLPIRSSRACPRRRGGRPVPSREAQHP
ncbi:MAG: hypothetical protein ACE5FG_10740 [Myxococcota bacterium]